MLLLFFFFMRSGMERVGTESKVKEGRRETVRYIKAEQKKDFQSHFSFTSTSSRSASVRSKSRLHFKLDVVDAPVCPQPLTTPPTPPDPLNGARDVARLASPRLASLCAPDVLPRSYFSQGICFGRGSLRGRAESDVETVGQLEWLRRRRRH